MNGSRTVNDDYLYQVRPPVRRTFVVNLRRRLSEQYPEIGSQKIAGFSMARFFVRSLSWKVALLFLLLLTALVFTVSEGARAQVLQWIETVAGFNVEERSESPLKDLETGVIQPTIQSVPTRTLPEVLANPPFSFGLPAWVPDGYELDNQVAIAKSKTWVSLTWRNPEGGQIIMLVEKEYTGYNIPAGVDSSEEIEINGQPALLILGNWDSHSQWEWDPSRGIAIYWIQDGRHYRLVYSQHDPVSNQTQPIEEVMKVAVIETLLLMAESIP